MLEIGGVSYDSQQSLGTWGVWCSLGVQGVVAEVSAPLADSCLM